jgi:hypothetical protein
MRPRLQFPWNWNWSRYFHIFAKLKETLDGPIAMSETTTSKRRPAESNFKQQKLPAWKPIMTSKWAIIGYALVGTVFIIIGIIALTTSGSVLTLRREYQAECLGKLIAWDSTAAPETCTVPIKLSDDAGWETNEVYVYYELDNFYQNHRRYSQSVSGAQMTGKGMKFDQPELLTDSFGESIVSDCRGFNDKYLDPSDETMVYQYPCGLIAASMFNDTLRLRRDSDGEIIDWPVTNPDDVAWSSDVSTRYKSPGLDWIKLNCKYIGGTGMTGFIDPKIATDLRTRPASDCGAPACGMRVLDDAGEPNNGIFNCWRNTTDQDMMVWMRIAALSTFRKLYRKIPANTLKKGETYTLEVDNRFPVQSFEGKKALVLSTSSFLGGKSSTLSSAYFVVGAICICTAIFFSTLLLFSPRILGDPRYLTGK